VHSFRLPFQETGATAIYVGTTPNQAGEVLELIRTELDKLMDTGITEEELERAKGHVQGALALANEDANSRMNRLGRDEITGVEHLGVDETVERIGRVTPEDVVAVAKAAYGGPYVLGAVGPFEDDDLAEHVA
jgi:predicted Zn-dependent peptidase